MMDQNDQNDRFDRFDRFEPDFSRFESASDRSGAARAASTAVSVPHAQATSVGTPGAFRHAYGQRQADAATPVKLTIRMVLCIAVLVLLLLTIIFGGLSSPPAVKLRT